MFKQIHENRGTQKRENQITYGSETVISFIIIIIIIIIRQIDLKKKKKKSFTNIVYQCEILKQ